MKTKTLALITAIGCGLVTGCVEREVVVPAPAAPTVETVAVVGPAPYPDAVWVPGHWGRYHRVWFRGHWRHRYYY